MRNIEKYIRNTISQQFQKKHIKIYFFKTFLLLSRGQYVLTAMLQKFSCLKYAKIDRFFGALITAPPEL